MHRLIPLFLAFVCSVVLCAEATAQQVTPPVTVTCNGQGFAFFDVEPFHGSPDELCSVDLVIGTEATVTYRVENYGDVPAHADASSGWMPTFSHRSGYPGFTQGNYFYANCGGLNLPAFDGTLDFHGISAGSILLGGGWASYVLPDHTGDFAAWTHANAPNGKHRIYLKSWSWADWTPGMLEWQYNIRAQYTISVVYGT